MCPKPPDAPPVFLGCQLGPGEFDQERPGSGIVFVFESSEIRFQRFQIGTGNGHALFAHLDLVEIPAYSRPGRVVVQCGRS